MALVLSLYRGHIDHTPHATFAMLRTYQHGHQLAHVQPITLGATLATIDLNTGGIHHMVGDRVGVEKAMQPEGFTGRFIATHHWGGFRETKASFGLGHLVEQARLVTRWDTPFARLLPMARGETELPGLFTQFKGEKQHRLSWVHCGRMLAVGRCGRHGLS